MAIGAGREQFSRARDPRISCDRTSAVARSGGSTILGNTIRSAVHAILMASACSAAGTALAQSAAETQRTPQGNSDPSTQAPVLVAQTVGAPAPQGAAQTRPGTTVSSETSAETADLSEITITGTRLTLNGNNMPTPVTVVSSELLLQTTPANIIDAVGQLPVFSGNTGPQGAIGGPSQNNAGHTLNIRDLGPTRALVLFDNLRVPPTTQTGVVNTDFIPSMLLQRVDVVTGGASAVYGSDAVAGVVNFVMDHNFNGVKVEGNAGISQRSDSPQFQIGLAGGTGFSNGLHIEGSYQYYKLNGIDSELDRPNSASGWIVSGAGTAANPYKLTENGRVPLWTYAGNISSGPLANMAFNQNGVLSPFVHGTPTGSGTIESGGEGYWFGPTGSLEGSVETHQFFGRADYDLSNDIHLHAQGIGSIQNTSNGFGNIFTPSGVKISDSDPYLPASVQAALPAGGSFTFDKIFDQAPPESTQATIDTYMANVGIDGKFSNWKWNFDFINSRNDQTVSSNGDWNFQSLYAGLDAVVNPANGQIVCHVTLTNPTADPGCVPINPFGPTASSAASMRYIVLPVEYEAVTTMNNVVGSISGSPVNTWAGPVQTAFTGEWRELSLNVVSNEQPSSFANCTGLTVLGDGAPGNCTATTPIEGNATVANSHGEQSVAEGAVEIGIPLLKNLPLAQDVSFNGAARFTRYNTSGSVWTWKLGLEWHIDDQFALRVARSRDIRAPNLYELFGPSQRSIGASSDVHTNSPIQAVAALTTSNPNLKPELGDTVTAGIVIRPEFLSGFSLSLDYFHIKIGNAIVLESGENTTVQQACEASNGTSPLCGLEIRPLPFSDHTAANFPTLFLQAPVNGQVLTTSGVDLDADYRRPLGEGRLTLRALVTYQPHLLEAAFPGAPTLDLANTPGTAAAPGEPTVRLVAYAGYDWHDVELNLQEQYRNAYSFWSSNRTQVYDTPSIPAFFTTNLTLGYKVRKQAEVYLNIQNLFDRQPPPFATPTLPGLVAGSPFGDDVIGRYFTLGFRVKY